MPAAALTFRVVLSLALLGPVAAAAQAPRLDLDAVRRIARLADAQISPDGRAVLVTVSRADHDANTMRSELVRVDVASGRQAVLLREQAGLGHVRWSPDGARIAFLAAAQDGRQVHVMPATATEAAAAAVTIVTRVPGGVQSFSWRPDGGALAFVAADPRTAAAGAAFEVGNDPYTIAAAPTPSHAWLVPASGGEARRLTSGTWSLSTSLAGSPLSWAPDGRSLALVRIASPSAGDTDQGQVAIVDTAGGEPRPLTGRKAYESGAAFSPDGARIAWSFPRDGDPSSTDEIMVAPASGGAGTSVTGALDRQVSMVGWWPDGKALLLGGTDGTRAALWLQPLAGPARKLPLGDVAAVSGASIARTGAVAFIGSEPARPPELYVLASPRATPRRLTNLNADIAALALGRSERVTWTTDGMTADGVVTYPPGFDPARRHPLVLVIHGGPTASSTEGFSALVQLMAARGWVVFQPNYRGSDNLGNTFQRAIANDAGEGPGRDVIRGIDALVARGFVDTARVAVSGWSYGGFMTAWLIGRYPGRWRAAVAGAAPVDLTDMYALTDLNVMRRHAITDSPFVGDNLAKYMAMSPLTHLSKARAPTLVMSVTGDVRVSVTGSYKIFHALRDNGVPTQFVAFPGTAHSPTDPVRQLERDRRWIEWLARWLEPAA